MNGTASPNPPQQLIVKESKNVPVNVLETLRHGSADGSCSELTCFALVLYGTAVASGLVPVDDETNAQDLSPQQINRLRCLVPECLYLPDMSKNTAALEFVCVPMRSYVFVYCSARAEKAGQEFSPVIEDSTNIYLPSYFHRDGDKLVLSNLETLISDLRSKIFAPAMAATAHAIERNLRLALVSFPEEILYNIVWRLNKNDIVAFGMTCQTLLRLTSVDNLWEELFISTFGKDPTELKTKGESMRSLFNREMNKRQQVAYTHTRRIPFIRRRLIEMNPPYSIFGEPSFAFGGDRDRFPFPALGGPGVYGFPSMNPFHPPSRWNPHWRLS